MSGSKGCNILPLTYGPVELHKLCISLVEIADDGCVLCLREERLAAQRKWDL